jgi:hypothetical protein
MKVEPEEWWKGGIEMEWYVILILVLGIPVILFPAAYVWYLNVGGIYAAIKEAREKKAARKEEIKGVADERPA